MHVMTGKRPGRLPFSDDPGLKRVTIHVGEIYVDDSPAVVQTLLGSCVSVCLTDRKAGVGGMNHILLPGKARLDDFDDAARYGINAMELLIGKAQSMGADRGNLEAKVFGGGNIITDLETRFNPGLRNGLFALDFLKLEGIRVVGRDIGGVNARRVYMRTDTGEVFLKRIPRSRVATVVEKEKEFRKKVKAEMSGAGRTTLFDT